MDNSTLRTGMSYDDLISGLAAEVDNLDPRQQAAVFWLAGTALRPRLEDAEQGRWATWFDEASVLGRQFITEGRVAAEAREVSERSLDVSDEDVLDATQLLNSVLICLNTPLILALEPDQHAGPWMVHALFPAVHVISLELYEDIAFPDDDGLDEVSATDRFQAAVNYLRMVCSRLRQNPILDGALLDELLQGSDALLAGGGRHY